MKMLSERIKMLREDKELNQRDFAKLIGVSQQTVASWETNRTSPDKDMLVKLSDFFDVSVDYLLKGTYKTSSSQSLSIEEEEIIKKYSMLGESERVSVNAVLDIEVDRHIKREEMIKKFEIDLDKSREERRAKLSETSLDEADYFYKLAYEDMYDENFNEFYNNLNDNEKFEYIKETVGLKERIAETTRLNQKQLSDVQTKRLINKIKNEKGDFFNEDFKKEIMENMSADEKSEFIKKISLVVNEVNREIEKTQKPKEKPFIKAASGMTKDTDVGAVDEDFNEMRRLKEEKDKKKKEKKD